MEPTSLKKLLQEEGVTCVHDGLQVTIHSSWIISGEDRLAYTSLIRLVECCREFHWLNDIVANANGVPVDSITKSISAEFIHPIPLGSIILITYRIETFRQKGYVLRFEIHSSSTQKVFAKLEMVSVFFDPVLGIAIPPPKSVLRYLQDISVLDE